MSEEKEWNNCKDGTNEEKISAFITLYPNSVHVGQAKYFLNIIRGEKIMHQGIIILLMNIIKMQMLIKH